MFSKSFIPFNGYYSSPFCKWQGSFQNENAIELGAKTARSWLLKKEIDPTIIDYLYFGNTVAQHRVFHSHNWAAAMVVDNKKHLPGLFVHQACSTSATCVYLAALNIEVGIYDTGFALMSDRCSNGPHTIWPNPKGPGGEVISENWNMDNMNFDPNAGFKMVQTGENVANEIGATREEADAMTVRRYEQYLDALKDDRAFQKRYMMPVEIRVNRKKTIIVEADEGVIPCTAEGLAKLRPLEPGGIHTFGSQTHPGDGNVGIIVTTNLKILKTYIKNGQSVGLIRIEAEETLGHYADWLNITTQSIRVLNGFKFSDPISIDQTIKIPLKKDAAQLFEVSRYEYHKEIEEDFFESFSVQDIETYKVKSRDNIWRVCANELELPVWLVKKYNPGVNFQFLYPKQIIKYPVISKNEDS